MRLTSFSDYALRLPMFSAASGGQLITIEEACQTHHISRGHLMKVANLLTREGYLKAVRGRSGANPRKPPKDIRLGDVVSDRTRLRTGRMF